MKQYIWIFIGLITIVSCQQKSEYRRQLEAGLASGERYDTLFFGYHFGMTKQQFFDRSWELNKQQLVYQGPVNQTVQYDLRDGQLKLPAAMNFYPAFYKDKAWEIPVKFEYRGWAPWNKERSATALRKDVLRLLEEWHGEGFFEVPHPIDSTAYIKIDGNRRITVVRDIGDKYVNVTYTDLTLEKQAEEEQKKVYEEGKKKLEEEKKRLMELQKQREGENEDSLSIE